MVQNIFKLLQFLSLFLEVIDFSFIRINSFVSVLNNQCLVLDIFLQLLIGKFQSLYFILIFSLLLCVIFFLLFLLLNFFLCYWHITFCPQWSFCDVLYLLWVLVLNLLQLFLFLLHNLPHGFFMFFLKSLYFPFYIIFLLPWSFYSVLEIFSHLLELSLVHLLMSLYFSLKLLWLLFLRSLKFIVFSTLLHYFFGLVRVKLLKSILKLLFFGSDFFIKFFTENILFFNYGVIFLHKLSFVRMILIFQLFDMIVFDWAWVIGALKIFFFLFQVVNLRFKSVHISFCDEDFIWNGKNFSQLVRSGLFVSNFEHH